MSNSGKIVFKLDKLLLASNVCIGEPTTAIAMSIA